MKAFLIILVIAALGGAGYYFFVYQERDAAGPLKEDESSMATANGAAVAPAPSQGEKAKGSAPADSSLPARETPSSPSAKPQSEPKSEIDRIVEQRYPMPQIIPLAQITQNWTAVPQRAFPAEVTASVPVPLDLIINGQKAGETRFPPGTPLKPLQLSGDRLTVANPANPSMRAQIDVGQTNFRQSIEKRYNDFVARTQNDLREKRAKAKQALLAQPDRVASLRRTGPSDPSNDPRFGPVKASINRGEAHPASLDEAVSFSWNGSERIGGELRGTYDTVSVRFEVQTIFGKFPTEYKCLLNGGQVVGWIDPITEERITR